LKIAHSQDTRVDDNDIEATKLIHRRVTASRIAVGSALSALIAKPIPPSSSIARTVSAALSGADT
jgi:hypothetical protein